MHWIKVEPRYYQAQGPPLSTGVSFVRIDPGDWKLPQDNQRVSSSVFQRSPIIIVVGLGFVSCFHLTTLSFFAGLQSPRALWASWGEVTFCHVRWGRDRPLPLTQTGLPPTNSFRKFPGQGKQATHTAQQTQRLQRQPRQPVVEVNRLVLPAMFNSQSCLLQLLTRGLGHDDARAYQVWKNWILSKGLTGTSIDF